MIFNKYDKVEIEQYLNNIPMYKYTKKILQNSSIELKDDEYYKFLEKKLIFLYYMFIPFYK
jgi:hypothetical protein